VKTVPFSFRLDAPEFIPSEYDNHVRRTLSAMKGQYLDRAAYDRRLAEADTLLYEVYENDCVDHNVAFLTIGAYPSFVRVK
jgi:hypothetical protein